MKKIFLLGMVCFAAIALNAQKVFVENFATAPTNGNLEGYNDWYVCLKTSDNLGVSPKIGEGALFYNGYYGSNIGKVAVLDSVIGAVATGTNGQRISTKIINFGVGDTLKNAVGQKIYAAFMINFSSHSYRSQRDFFTFEGSSGSSMTRGRLFAKLNTAGTDITFAISKNSSTSGTYVEGQPIVGGVGINHLIVMCYQGVDGDSNDIISVYIDPDLSLSEEQQTNKLTATDAATDYSTTVPFRINLRQRGTGAQIGGIRVGTSWNSVLLGTGTGFSQVEKNSINISSAGKTIITSESGSLNVYNLAGKQILSSKTEGKLATTLANGLYLVRFISIDGKVQSAKIEIK